MAHCVLLALSEPPEFLEGTGMGLPEPHVGTSFYETSHSLAFQRAELGARFVSDAAERLYAAAERENQRDAEHRIRRAISTARQNMASLPGHGSKHPSAETARIALLSKQAQKLAGRRKDVAGSDACKLGCSGHGSCNAETQMCECVASHTGTLCDVPRCPDDCKSRGMCIAGQCICGSRHFGASCEHERCPGDCSGHGYCFNARCQCSGNYGGEDCFLQLQSQNVVRLSLGKKPGLKGIPQKISSLRATTHES